MRRACCDTYGTTWGKGIGPPPSGCTGSACAGGNPDQAGAGDTEKGSGQTSAKVTKTPAVCPLLGDVALTTVEGKCPSCQWAANGVFPIGENIYGPFEAGFTAKQDTILEGLGCNPGSLGHMAGGIDTKTAEAMMSHQCSITLPRYDNGKYVSMLDECGGHTKEYHFHERLKCLYTSAAGSKHSPKIGDGSDGHGFYGKWEDYSTGTLPKLDVCGGHFGVTPDSNGKIVYHYHVQDNAPFTMGCFGPDADANGNMKLVSLAKCRELYKTVKANDGTYACGDTSQVTTTNGTITYDNWCPCYDATGSNTGNVELPVWNDALAVTCSDSKCSKTSTTTSSTPNYAITGTLTLGGIYAVQLSAVDKLNIQGVIAAKVGLVCGSNGATACTSADVVITVARRDVTVSYTIKVYSSAAKTSGTNTFAAVNAADLNAAFKAKGGTLSGITSSKVVDATSGATYLQTTGVAYLISAVVVLFATRR